MRGRLDMVRRESEREVRGKRVMRLVQKVGGVVVEGDLNRVL